MDNISRGKMAGGDMIPWTVSQQYQDDDFASLSGARVVRIAVHPDYAKVSFFFLFFGDSLDGERGD